MKYYVRKHNLRAQNKYWWRRYFWSQNEYWTKFAVYKAAQRAKVVKLTGKGSYFFWNQVSLRATKYYQANYGVVPDLLLSRPIARSPWALSSPEINKWLRSTPPPFHSRKT